MKFLELLTEKVHGFSLFIIDLSLSLVEELATSEEQISERSQAGINQLEGTLFSKLSDERKLSVALLLLSCFSYQIAAREPL
jgi:hypothetical protein